MRPEQPSVRLAVAERVIGEGVVLLALLAWWALARGLPEFILPGPVAVARRLVELFAAPEFLWHVFTSSWRVLVSIAAALLIGGGLAFLAHGVPWLESVVDERIKPVLNSFPSIGWAILAAIWFEPGDFGVVFVEVAILIPFCLINIAEGLRNIDRELMEMGRSFTRRRARILWRLTLPLLVPYGLSATRIAYGIAWKIAFKSLPFARFVAAQGEVARLEKKFADALAPFWPVIDGKVYPGEAAPALKAGAGAEVDVMIGTTREEMAAFYCIDPDIAKADAAAIEGVFASVFKSGHRPYYDEMRRTRASATNAALLGDLMSDAMFRIGSLRKAEWRADQGRPAYVYQFDWQSPAGFESCHCIEIPFVFNNFPGWTDSPMLKGAKPEETRGLAEAMHGAWIAFARSGTPEHPGLPPWPPYRRADRMTMRFDSTIGPVRDLAGLSWRQPWPS